MPLDLEAIKADMQENLAEIRTIEDVARRNKISAETLKKRIFEKGGDWHFRILGKNKS